MSAPQTPDPPARLVAAVSTARAAAVEEAAADLGADRAAAAVGEHLEAVSEDPGAVTHYFAAAQGGYRGWRWSVTVAEGGEDTPVTVCEVVLVPGAGALVAPAWVPWDERIRPGDLGVGDLLPPPENDDRLVPAYAGPDDEALAEEIGLGRVTVLSRAGRLDAAQRWHDGPHGPGADMARAAPAHCGTCGYLLALAGSLRGAFGVCGNEFAPADGAVVEVGFGCGAHSDVRVPSTSPVTVAELVYDDGVELEPAGPAVQG